MELVKWSLNAIDTIFSTRSRGSGEPACPDGSFAAGYAMDAWEKWRVVCLAPLSLEDIEDVYLFGTLIAGSLLFGLSGFLVYRKIYNVGLAVQGPHKLPDMIEVLGRTVSAQTGTVSRNVDSIMEKTGTISCNVDSIMEKLSVLQRSVDRMGDRIDRLDDRREG